MSGLPNRSSGLWSPVHLLVFSNGELDGFTLQSHRPRKGRPERRPLAGVVERSAAVPAGPMMTIRPMADRTHTREVNPMAKQIKKSGKDILEKRRDKKAKQAAESPKLRKTARAMS